MSIQPREPEAGREHPMTQSDPTREEWLTKQIRENAAYWEDEIAQQPWRAGDFARHILAALPTTPTARPAPASSDLVTALDRALGSLPEESIRQEYEPGSTHEGGPALFVEWDALVAALRSSPADKTPDHPTIERWIDSLHENHNGIVWITKAELRQVLGVATNGPTEPSPE